MWSQMPSSNGRRLKTMASTRLAAQAPAVVLRVQKSARAAGQQRTVHLQSKEICAPREVMHRATSPRSPSSNGCSKQRRWTSCSSGTSRTPEDDARASRNRDVRTRTRVSPETPSSESGFPGSSSNTTRVTDVNGAKASCQSSTITWDRSAGGNLNVTVVGSSVLRRGP